MFAFYTRLTTMVFLNSICVVYGDLGWLADAGVAGLLLRCSETQHGSGAQSMPIQSHGNGCPLQTSAKFYIKKGQEDRKVSKFQGRVRRLYDNRRELDLQCSLHRM